MSVTSVPPSSSPEHPSMVPEVAQIVALFFDGGRLEDVSFPNVGRESFDLLARQLKGCQEQVEELRHLLAKARKALIEAETELLERSEMALAYARIYARGDEELRGHLDGLLMAQRQAKAVRPKKRRRKSSAERASASADSAGELPLVAVG